MYRIGPIGRKSNFHSREKCLIGLVLATLCFLCFGGIFLLPDNFGSERVLRVYKHFQKAGPEIFIPAPPLAAHAPRDEDPHFMGDRQRLQQKIIAELGDIFDEPQAAADAVAQAPAPVPAAQQEQPMEQEAPPEMAAHHRVSMPASDDTILNNNNNNPLHGEQQLKLPMGMGRELAAEHADAGIKEKRLKVKEVSKYVRMCFVIPNNKTCVGLSLALSPPLTPSRAIRSALISTNCAVSLLH